MSRAGWVIRKAKREQQVACGSLTHRPARQFPFADAPRSCGVSGTP